MQTTRTTNQLVHVDLIDRHLVLVAIQEGEVGAVVVGGTYFPRGIKPSMNTRLTIRDIVINIHMLGWPRRRYVDVI